MSGKTLNDAAAKAEVAQIVYHSGPLMLPNGMDIKAAIDLLNRREQFLEEKVDIRETFDVFPWDGANAIDAVLTKKFGWAAATATPGFFGPQPPKLISIDVGPNLVKQVPWGAFSLPGIQGLLHTSADTKNGRYVFSLIAQVKRKDEATIRSIFEDVREYLKHNSIYRGKAIKIRFNDDDGDKLQLPEPKFMDVSNIKEDMVIYTDKVQDAIQTNLFTPIRRVDDCIKNGIPIKRGILLGGTYGTGKTLAAHVGSKIAVDHDITYLYVPRADELSDAIEFAKQYQSPACVIFCEDIDRVLSGERDVEMDDILNIIDGIDTKSSHLIVVLTTNDLQAINPAMLRPGRLDAVIEVTPPDAKAVQALIRLYGGKQIDKDTDLTKVSAIMDGNIPAVIAEVVKRAKLAQLAIQKPGEKITKLSEAALMHAAETIQPQLKLLKDATDNKPRDVSDLEFVIGQMLQKAVGGAYEQINEIENKVSKIHEEVC